MLLAWTIWSNSLSSMCSRSIIWIHTAPGSYLLYASGALCIQICSWSIFDLEYYSRLFMLQEHAPGAYACSIIQGQNLKEACVHEHIYKPIILTAHNCQKWKSVFPTCPCHRIYRVEAVCLSIANYALKITTSVNMWDLGQFRENLLFCYIDGKNPCIAQFNGLNLKVCDLNVRWTWKDRDQDVWATTPLFYPLDEVFLKSEVAWD